ncbi:putative late blight resistance protein homolog R1B-17 [Ipomoea triloba]|uniref:putative late blight resistance protein homolog R1B-17 n=1 Tax=Ipomoea triloba TaxID=35885 RepID=UPI00125CE247|nr:putative late blight resistance protein homolog R1B-17 [Ipomoea triloba]
MDFDVVTTLIEIVEQDLVEPELLSIFDAEGMKVALLHKIELLSVNLCFLQACLEDCKTKMNDGDTWAKILYEDVRDKVATIYENCKIKSKLSEVYAEANSEGYEDECCRSLHWTLNDMVGDFEELGKWILKEKKKRTALELEEQNITVWDTYQNALEPENEVIVGFHSDIKTITNWLFYSHLMRSVFTIFRNSNIEQFRKYVEKYPSRYCHNAEQKLQVIPFVGEGGIGKTTLAKRVYGHPITIACFQIRAWVVVSQVHNLKEMLIGRCISPITSEIYDIDDAQIAEQLCRSLMGQKYLIFLDDIWTTAAWDAIQGCFPENFNGSHILVTTRFTEVAEYLSANPFHVAYQTLKDRWELVSRKVFGQSKCAPRDYELIGKCIVLGCSGLPLAVVLIAGLLATAKESLEICDKCIFDHI